MYQFPQMLQKLMECHPTYRRRITQKELAEHVGVRPQTVSLYLKGETAPSPRLLLKMADYLCVSTDYLLTGQDGEQSGDVITDVITMDSLRDIQKQVCGIMCQTNTLIAEMEAKK